MSKDVNHFSLKSFIKEEFASGLRQSLFVQYNKSLFLRDLRAGLVVSLIAIPLGMAIGIACGLSPQNGLYAVVVIGLIAAIAGGSRFQVSGPTASFAAVLAPISAQFGAQGIFMVGLLAGIILFGMALSRFGRFLTLIPYPVTTGYTLGSAVLIASIQIKDFFGLTYDEAPSNFLTRIYLLFDHWQSVQWQETAIGVFTFVVLLKWPAKFKNLPSPLISVMSAALFAWLFNHLMPSANIDTIASRYHYKLPDGGTAQGIPALLPQFDFAFLFNWANFHSSLSVLLPAALAIAILASLEALFSATISDSLTNTKHKPNGELLGLALSNMIAPFFGALPGSGALARTSTSIRYGAYSPLSAIIHSFICLVILLLGANIISLIPMASLAALLMFIAVKLININHLKHLIEVAPKSDLFIIFICTFLIIAFDMVFGIVTGVVLASLLFMKNLADSTESRISSSNLPNESDALSTYPPSKTVVFSINGPLFFAVAEKALRALEVIGSDINQVDFDFSQTNTFDLTGIVAFETTVLKLRDKNIKLRLVNVNKNLKRSLAKSDVIAPYLHDDVKS
ncbi:MAG: STAS domain-containing protein [Oligoflexales bacterium]|nr:STAS domain-containing protein [Oligoflexales bacterium]